MSFSRSLSRALLAAAIPAVAHSQSGATFAWHQTPAQLASTCRAALKDMQGEIERILSRPKAEWTFANTLRPIEEASSTLFSKTSPQTFMLYVSPDAAVRDSAQACSQATSNVGAELGADPRIYAAAHKGSSESGLKPIDKQLAKLWAEGGRKSGAGLDSATRVRVTGLYQRLSDLGRDYSVALAADSTSMIITDADAASLPPQLRATLKPTGGGLRLPINESTIGDVMRNEKNPDVRKRFFELFNSRGGMPNIDRLRAAVAIRDTIAHLSGFSTWAAFQLDTKMAKDPAKVIKFLTDVDQGLLQKARDEQAAMAPLAQRDGRPVPVQAWDASFYRNELRRTKYALDVEAVRQYFPVDHVLPAVLGIYSELLGVSFAEKQNPDVWAPGVREFVVSDAATRAPMGTVYFDLFPRPNKYDHFASFSLHSAMCLSGKTPCQSPVNAIVGNWPEPAPGKPSVLTHGDVEVFFHEFGHAMAAMLDKSIYATTGTNGLRQDFVEALSQALENWMWQPSILKRVSKHATTGAALPDSLIDRMIALKRFAAGYNWTAQAFYAQYDMTLHSSGASVDPVKLWAELQPKLMVDSMMTGTIPPASFGHLMGGYDAGYYGYLWSKVYAQDLFTRFEKEGIMSKTAGRAYRDMILAPGATEEPDVLVQRFLGRPLSFEAFYRELGIVKK